MTDSTKLKALPNKLPPMSLRSLAVSSLWWGSDFQSKKCLLNLRLFCVSHLYKGQASFTGLRRKRSLSTTQGTWCPDLLV